MECFWFGVMLNDIKFVEYCVHLVYVENIRHIKTKLKSCSLHSFPGMERINYVYIKVYMSVLFIVVNIDKSFTACLAIITWRKSSLHLGVTFLTM